MKKYSAILLVVAVAVLGVLLYIISNREEDREQAGLTKVRVQLQWFDGAQFTGLYVAKNKKFFEEEGLDVELISGSYNIDPFTTIKEGRADIGMATGDRVLINYATGRDIKAFGTVFKQSTACFMAKEGQIKNIQDFKGKKIGVYRKYDTENILKSLLFKNNISEDEVKIVDAGDIAAFRTGELDLFPSYVFNEPITMQLEGITTTLFNPKDFGVSFYSDTYFSTDDYYNNNKDVIKRFLRASAKGWEYAKNNQEESIGIMFGMITNMTFSENHIKQRKSLEELVKYLGDGNDNKVNYMQREKWVEMEKLLVGIGLIQHVGNVDALCDFKIINEK